ncbi:DUF6691 family protein [Phaeobacter inhibens]|uniref:Transporter component n=1 Tax=Phaeobacter inhibens TaxID=221822 RepID=A0A2I7K7Y2_9RHOB|nr:DUF6691 family protein [Phaeobacter inhibens]AUQ50313.1 putative transporter component [Phaeobacter inhibens]AUQ53956.1 putative transporter component [Phaeobacter inhibens]AUQ62254.1 putative transporter component [Phaeobacter inhibens]AUQ66828.1 putative transporter component [Phaeobacter inhibens]AUQ70154.1 putative transporter component [Phaeobacter inhibens]
MRLLLSFSAGGLFGLGLFLSGMTDTQKVQGWLDIFGAWDPTLAFVMGGAILPMALAWQLTRGRAPLVGGHFPTPPRQELDRRLIIGSVLFGIGWGLAGLCPGPAIASLSYGGTGGIIFIAAMLVGMIAAPPVALRLDRAAAST